jgi:hypothetical protein|eukprot:5858061-Prymnesium_polylepis.2
MASEAQKRAMRHANERCAQQAIDALLVQLKVMKGVVSTASSDLAKAKLRVYYAVLQGDSVKCRSAIDAFVKLCHTCLEETMEGHAGLCVLYKDELYHADETKISENARRIGKSLKNSIEWMEQSLERMALY